MEKQLRPQTATLVANTTVTLTWSGTDFIQAFKESIIKKPVSIRFTCSATGANSVNCGVRYATLKKTYQVAERKTLFIIPAGGSIEATPMSKPALGLLFEYITSISIDLTSASGGTATIQLIIDDEPPPLTSDPGQFTGLDAILNEDYIIISVTQPVAITAGTSPQSGTLYTVPLGKRFFLDSYVIYVGVTPSFPNTVQANLVMNYPAGGFPYIAYSLTEFDNIQTEMVSNLPPLPGGQTITYLVTSVDPNARAVSFVIFGREVF